MFALQKGTLPQVDTVLATANAPECEAARDGFVIESERAFEFGRIVGIYQDGGDVLKRMRSLKSALDQKGILNPGKLFLDSWMLNGHS